MGMGRVGTGAYDEFKAQGHLTVGLDSDPGKAEMHRKAGRRVLYADAEDPGFWSHLDLHGVETVVLTMTEMEANRDREALRIRQLEDELDQMREEVAGAGVTSESLVPIVVRHLAAIRQQVANGFPFKVGERLAELSPAVEYVLLDREAASLARLPASATSFGSLTSRLGTS